ncbi:Kinesin-like protein [Actinidia chinensis var. chinensis]|uniref:Kinesin-like protein n=1 Tax=Actinidia chinensis var. chinensis TaxID=1590841 RepID=A0A2R6Q276_ACTCC|nr:Kinesin-like protein [Actinidia chinensis var. chinensis]
MGEEKGGDEENPKKHPNPEENRKKAPKSCKGCLYFSSNAHNPLCVGITRSLPQVPNYIVGESEIEVSREGRSLTDFKYACVGYSLYSAGKDHSVDVLDTQAKLPVCIGLEVLVDRTANTVDPALAPAPVHVHNKEDIRGFPQPRTHKPTHSVGDEFLSRFSRNSGVVAMGIAKNLHKAGDRIKERLDDILYPYRKRPK